MTAKSSIVYIEIGLKEVLKSYTKYLKGDGWMTAALDIGKDKVIYKKYVFGDTK